MRRLVPLAVSGWAAAGLPYLAIGPDHARHRLWSAAARGDRHDPTAGTGAEKPGPGGARANGEVERGSFAAGHPPTSSGAPADPIASVAYRPVKAASARPSRCA